MRDELRHATSEFSFVLCPSRYGIGVFATHPIAAGAALRLCRNDVEEISHVARTADVPEAFHRYCIPISSEELIRPNDFGAMELIWFVNHSGRPNAGHSEFLYRALRDIESGEEITIDYNTLGIPAELRDDYFRRG